jgi:hypothetical protein
MPLQDGTQLQQIGQALGGFGAGIQGNAPQYQAAQQTIAASKQEMEEARTKAMYADALGALNFAEADDWDGAIQLGMNRLQALQQLNANPEDTQRIMKVLLAAKNGNEEAKSLAKAELKSIVETGYVSGGLERPEGSDNVVSGSDVVNGQIITGSAKKGFTAQTIAGLVPPEEDEGGADQRERKIKQYMEFFDLTREEAIERNDSVVMMDDKGNQTIYNPITQTSRVLIPEGLEKSDAPQFTFNTELGDLAYDPGEGTGFAASFIGLWNNTLGQIPFMLFGDTTEETAQNLRFLERDAIRALASSGRPPVVEQERIMATVPDALSWFENPRGAQLKMTNFVDMMMQQYIDDKRFAANLRNDRQLREDSSRRGNEIESIMRRVLTQEASEAMFDTINGLEQKRGDIQGLSDAELIALDPLTLDEASLDFYIERLKEIE